MNGGTLANFGPRYSAGGSLFASEGPRFDSSPDGVIGRPLSAFPEFYFSADTISLELAKKCVPLFLSAFDLMNGIPLIRSIRVAQLIGGRRPCMVSCTVAYKFSPQQITGINYYYSKIVARTFEEDDVRLLLIHLREFLRNRDNRGAAGRENALLLREAGDSVAHTIRDQGLLHDRLLEHIPHLAGPARDIGRVPHPLFDLNKLVDALKDALEDSGVLYAPGNISEVIARESIDVKICLISLLNGMVLRFEYPTIRNDFFFFSPEAKPAVYIRTEVEPNAGIHELRLNAALPYTGGKFNACVVLCVVEDRSKIEQTAMNRTHSNDGYCEPIRAFRRNGVLRLGAVPTGVSSTHLHDIRRALAYDTNPYPRNSGLVMPPGFEAWVNGGPLPSP